MQIAWAIYRACGEFLNVLAGGACVFVIWTLTTATVASSNLGLAESQAALYFAAKFIGVTFPLTLAVMAAARLFIILKEPPVRRIAD